MAHGMLHRTRAKRRARMWQAGFAAAVLSAGALWAFEIPGVTGPVTVAAPAAVPITDPSAGGAGDPVVRVVSLSGDDVTAMSEMLERTLGRPKAKETEPDEPGVAPTTGPGWRYLGSIIDSRRRVALISVDGTQRMLAEGRTIGSTTLVSVQVDSIVIDDGSGHRELYKEERSGPLVTWVTPVTMEGYQDPGMVNAASINQPARGLSAEAMARLRERGIDPGRASRLRPVVRDMQGGGSNPRAVPIPNSRSDEATKFDATGDAAEDDSTQKKDGGSPEVDP